jgi:hypothetical protein
MVMERKFSTYTNENGTEIQAHRVTEDTEAPVLTLDGNGRETHAGEVLIGTSNPNVFIVGGDSLLDGYTESDDEETTERGVGDGDVTPRDDDFNPSDNNADVVRRYLEAARVRGDRDEFNRVVALEQADKNRASALVDYDR